MKTMTVELNLLEDISVVPLRDMVVFPHGVQPLFVGTPRSIAALEFAMAGNKQVFLVSKKDPDTEQPKENDLYEVGTVSTLLQLLKLPDGTVKVLVEGGDRAAMRALNDDGEFLVATVEIIESPELTESEREAMTRSLMAEFDRYVKATKQLSKDVLASVASIDDPGRLIDTIAVQLALGLEDKQSILEATDMQVRREKLLALLDSEIEVQTLEKSIRGRVKTQMEKSQREYYLSEQMKAIQKELGNDEATLDELDEIRKRINEVGMPKDAKTKATSELSKLQLMAPMSAEATVSRSYLDWLLSVPWKKRTRIRKDIRKAKERLDADHYGLDEVKERILEFLAVQARVGKVKGPVLCLVGPPGVGKTSLGESIARATNRKFIRMALGGVRDEAEIRGHRRTYIGSLPGKIMQKLAKAGVRNPLFLLDEIDKMGMDFRGDPASALLEVLDSEQNHAFDDHYLEIDYDLSEVFFVCTSNSMNIPPVLLDRMEVIRLAGYTEDEKKNIASRFLLPKQKRLNGVSDKENFSISDEALLQLIRYYTREAGVRGLEREIAKLCRKVVTEQALDGSVVAGVVEPDALEKHNGIRKFNFGRAEEENQVGIVTALAWTQVGGELLNIEAVAVPGKGLQTKTGSLGDVMQESIQAALTFVRSRASVLGVPLDFHETLDIHVHVPEGATPKDGPSAGIGMCTAVVSVLTAIPVRAEVAMTGEITLRGHVLPIGGLKEKLLAAHRGGIEMVIIPEENERDLKEVPDNIKEDLDIRPVKSMDQVIELALERRPEPLDEELPKNAGITPVEKSIDGGPVVNPH
ncbi:MAG: endopeptidase La [Pseudomonadales bacterium]